MKEFKGTPGPWLVDGQSNGARWNIDDHQGHAVAMSFQRPDDKGYEVRDANANLIAAAPELLEAMESLILFTKPSKSNAVALANAHAVIAKALGEQK